MIPSEVGRSSVTKSEEATNGYDSEHAGPEDEAGGGAGARQRAEGPASREG